MKNSLLCLLLLLLAMPAHADVLIDKASSWDSKAGTVLYKAVSVTQQKPFYMSIHLSVQHDPAHSQPIYYIYFIVADHFSVVPDALLLNIDGKEIILNNITRRSTGYVYEKMQYHLTLSVDEALFNQILQLQSHFSFAPMAGDKTLKLLALNMQEIRDLKQELHKVINPHIILPLYGR